MAEQDNPLQKVITKCWEDEAFKERLLADPAATLAAEGVQVPEGITVNVAVDAADVRTLVIPLPPTGELGDAQLQAAVAGAPYGRACGTIVSPWAAQYVPL
jgi:hypothetical protein